MNRIAVVLALAIALSVSPSYAGIEPPVVTDIEVSDASCRIVWSPAEGAVGYNVYLENPDGDYLAINEEPLRETSVTLESLANGMPYRFAVTAVDDGGAESSAVETGMVVPVGNGHTVIAFKGGDSVADYRVFSVPFIAKESRPEKVFGYLPAYDQSLWRLFTLERDGYVEFDDIKRIEPGKAYWLLTRFDTELFLAGRTVNNYEPFTVVLHPGWNIVASPFLYPVAWEETLARNPAYADYIDRDIWEFADGGFHRVDVLKPYEGYFVFNASGSDIPLLIPPVPLRPKVFEEIKTETIYPAATPQSGSNGERGWLMNLSANDGRYRDIDNLLGIDPAANDGPDGMDAEEPPAWPQHLSLYFSRTGDEATRHASEIHRTRGEWVARVEGGENTRITLEWRFLQESADLLLIDTVHNVTIDMKEKGFYTFSRDITSVHEFIIREKTAVK